MPRQPGDILAQRMAHFVTALHQFAMGRLLHSAWPDLLQEIGQAQSLDGVRAAHGKFLDAAARQCLLVPTRTWRLLQDAVLRILDLILKFADLRHRLKNLGDWRVHLLLLNYFVSSDGGCIAQSCAIGCLVSLGP
ncbi:hypothetical protein WJX84_009879 [Apatococcus fuscideae]|uniref:Gamma-tubulin complex component n=1 Tax=Apatococcus fuscideae TaxID=2026836 RepID=A0AAW1T0K1_9CHLO